jgi:hypothetical protein
LFMPRSQHFHTPYSERNNYGTLTSFNLSPAPFSWSRKAKTAELDQLMTQTTVTTMTITCCNSTLGGEISLVLSPYNQQLCFDDMQTRTAQRPNCSCSAILSVVRLSVTCTKQLDNAITMQRMLGICLLSLYITSFGFEERTVLYEPPLKETKLTAVGAVLPDVTLRQVPDRHGWNKKNNQLTAIHQH